MKNNLEGAACGLIATGETQQWSVRRKYLDVLELYKDGKQTDINLKGYGNPAGGSATDQRSGVSLFRCISSDPSQNQLAGWPAR